MWVNPHNPSGRVFTRSEQEQIGNLCVKYDKYILSDEIYSDFVGPPYKHVPMASIS